MTSHYVSGGSSESYSSGSSYSSYGDYDSDSDYSDMSIYSSTSVLTTPNVRKVASMRNERHDEKMTALHNDLKDYILKTNDFEKFICNVYGLSESDVEYINGREWFLDSTHLAEYLSVLAKAEHESNLYKPFKGIVDSLYATMRSDGYRIDTTLVALGNTQLKCPYTGTIRKPDGLFLSGEMAENSSPKWSLSKTHVEMYKSRSASTFTSLLETLVEAPPSDSGASPPSNIETRSQAKARKQSPNARRSSTVTTKKGPSRRRPRATRETRSMDSPSAPIPTTPPILSPSVDIVWNADRPHASSGNASSSRASGKRSRAPEQDNQRKRHRSDLTKKATQSAGYALEALSATPRRWATGLLIRDFCITVQYYDRCGAIFSPTFDFHKEPEKLALLALAIGQATPTQAGFEPYLVPAGSTSLSAPLSSLAGSQLLVPPPGDYSAPELRTDLSIPDTTWSNFFVDGDPLYVYRGVNGRGSIILPGHFDQAAEEAEDQEKTEGSTVKGTKVQVIAERGSEFPKDIGPVFEIEKIGVDEDLGDIVKLSWPDEGRSRQEPELLEILSEKIPWMREHLPEVLASVTMNVHIAGLPRALFIEQSIEEHNNKLQASSSSQANEIHGNPLECPSSDDAIAEHGNQYQAPTPSSHQEIEEHSDRLGGLPQDHANEEQSIQPKDPSSKQTVGNFKSEFELGIRHFTIMIVRRYQHLWEVKNVKDFEKIYVDLVECHHYAARFGKVLHRDLSENNLLWKSRNGNAYGVLNDFDLASLLDEETEDKQNRTGTGPFMAIDLLDRRYKGGHLYRHDLESLFYVLVWASVRYDLGAEEPRMLCLNSSLVPWTSAYNTARGNKVSFFSSTSDRDDVYDTVCPVFEELRERWLIPLWNLFSHAFAYALVKKVKLEDAITFEAYMNALGYKPRMEAQNQQPAA